MANIAPCGHGLPSGAMATRLLCVPDSGFATYRRRTAGMRPDRLASLVTRLARLLSPVCHPSLIRYLISPL